MKYCKSCEVEKPLDEFYKDKRAKDGRYTVCKICHGNKTRFYVSTNKYQRKTKRIRNKAYANEYMKTYTRLPEQIIKNKSRDKLKNAVRRGRMKRLPCQECAEPKTDAHHPDYSKPLEVVWLCRKHHSQIHAGRLILK